MIYLALIFAALAGACNAVMDRSEEGRTFRWKFDPLYWHKNRSWVLKWKRGPDGKVLQGEAFPGSSTFFVAFTGDRWHLFKFLMLTFWSLSITLYALDPLQPSQWWLVLIGARAGFGVGFTPTYRWIVK
jgi:hypothetical protein